MPTYIAFLRAVNVGGRYLKMADLRDALTQAGFGDVQTHIQSGNVLVRSRRRSTSAVAAEMEGVLREVAGFDVPCLVRTPAEVRGILEAADGIPPMLTGTVRRYLALADGPVSAQAAATLDAWDREGERAKVLGSEVLAELAVGFHKTTLTNARLERVTGRTTTWRDLEVVRAVDERWGT